MNSSSRYALGFTAVGLLVALALSTGAATAGHSQERKGRAAEGWTDDKGKFRFLVDGQQVGSEDFQITRNGNEWVARGSVEISKGDGGPAKLHGKLRLSAEGSPLQYEYEWSPQAGKKVSAKVAFQGGTARMESQVEGATPFMQDFAFDTPRVVILDNNLYHHYAVLAWLYDWEKKGSQTFPVLIPQDQTPGTITVDWMGPREIGSTKFDVLRVRSADLEIELYLDSGGRLARLAVPSSKAEIVRE